MVVNKLQESFQQASTVEIVQYSPWKLRNSGFISVYTHT